MEYIFTDDDYISTSDHWFHEMKSKFMIINPKNLPLEYLSAKYQLFHIQVDPFEFLGKPNYSPNMNMLVATNCFTGAQKYLSRSLVIGEPKPSAILNWLNLYAKDSAYTEIAKEELKTRSYGSQYSYVKKFFNSAEELLSSKEKRYYEFAFIWY